MKNYVIALALLISVSHSLADVVIHLQTKASPATTQPTADESAVSISAVPGHEFATDFQFNGRTISVNGTIETAATDGEYRIKIEFADRDPDRGSRGFKTVVKLKANDPVEIAKMQKAGSVLSTVLTVAPGKT